MMTPQQAKVLTFVRSSIERNQFSPTLREIAAAIGRKNSAAKRLVDALVDKGYLMRRPYRARSLSLPGSNHAPGRSDPDVMSAARTVLDSIVHENVDAGVVTVRADAIGALDVAVAEAAALPPATTLRAPT